jgi:hypothetical protein
LPAGIGSRRPDVPESLGSPFGGRFRACTIPDRYRRRLLISVIALTYLVTNPVIDKM